MSKTIIFSENAPAAIGTYSQAVRHGDLVFLSGQIPLDPVTMDLVTASTEAQVRQVFENLQAVCEAAGGSLADIIKLTVFLTDMDEFPTVNEVMGEFFRAPYPARAALGVAALPRGAAVEMEAVMGC
ncbi:MAG: RidA family protein [Xanthomonadales bacterium]|nr:RidA family protein [Gammaproteobacteria bacterium]NNE06004.1 RidA family protein [Xanthomonadales bacterium]NNL94715.1 RidA family protein [Xanthomonadales bacterium]